MIPRCFRWNSSVLINTQLQLGAGAAARTFPTASAVLITRLSARPESAAIWPRDTHPYGLSASGVVSFIVPAHNEQTCLPHTLQAIHESARATGQPYEII